MPPQEPLLGDSSYLQTRALLDALTMADEILRGRGTRFLRPAAWLELQTCFSPTPIPGFFSSCAFSAESYDDAFAFISAVAPELAAALVRPRSDYDFTVVGVCRFQVQFAVDPGGSEDVELRLSNGAVVHGARIRSAQAAVYENGVIEIATLCGRRVLLLVPEPTSPGAAELARSAIVGAGQRRALRLELTFPVAKTRGQADIGWVTQIRSACDQYEIGAVVSRGEAQLDRFGFAAEEIAVADVRYLASGAEYVAMCVDRPFMAALADASGIHAVAWFGTDAFTPIEEARESSQAGQSSSGPWDPSALLRFYDSVACICAFPRARQLLAFEPAPGLYAVDALELHAALHRRAMGAAGSYVSFGQGHFRCRRCGSLWREQQELVEGDSRGSIWRCHFESDTAEAIGAPAGQVVPLASGLCGRRPTSAAEVRAVMARIRNVSPSILDSYLRQMG